MFAPEWLDDWPDQDHRSRLVFIVHDIPRSEILGHFAFARPLPFAPTLTLPRKRGRVRVGAAGEGAGGRFSS
jgi:hypothetical protein